MPERCRLPQNVNAKSFHRGLAIFENDEASRNEHVHSVRILRALQTVITVLEAPGDVLVVDPCVRNEVVPQPPEVPMERPVMKGSVDDEYVVFWHEL